jgi:phosphoenolpyruvate carboxykinase (GTP)
VDTPIGYLPLHQDLKVLFKELIDKDYPKDLYLKQFSLYLDNIIARIDLQIEAYGKEANLPARLFEVLNEQRHELAALRQTHGAIVSPFDLVKESDAG